jgi:hypothetical protein
MAQDLIFAPMGAMALLTFAVLLFIPIRRFRAGASGLVKVEDFRFGESAAVPPDVSIPNRNYMNLLELPTLFFPACLMFYVAARVDVVALVTAWTYVALRAIHSAVHLTYNNVRHRLIVFALSNAVLGALWVLFFLHRR